MRKVLFFFILGVTILTSILLYFFFGDKTNNPEKFFSKEILLAVDFMDEKAYDSAIYFAKKDISHLNNPYNACYIYNLIGYSYKMVENYDSSYFYYTKCIKSTKNVEEKYQSRSIILKAISCNQIGLIFKEKHLYSESTSYFNEAAKIFESEGKQQICKAYYNLAYAQSQINDISCIESYYKALEYASKYNDPKYEMTCMNSIGYLMLETNNLDAAIDYFNSALKTEYSKDHPKLKSFCFHGLGEGYLKLRQLDKAKFWAQKSLDLKLNENIEDHLFSTYHLLAQIYRDTNELERAEDYFKKAVIYFYFDDTKQNRQSIAVFKNLSDLQLEMGKLQQSAVNNERHFKELEKFFDEKRKATILAQSDSNLLSMHFDNPL